MSEWFAFAVRVNGVEFREVFLRSCDGHRAKCEVVIQDRQLGNFALHEEFLLEVLEDEKENARWRHVSLLELTNAISREALSRDANFGQDTISNSSSVLYSGRNPRSTLERIPVEGDASHIDRLHTALIGAKIRYQIVGGLDSRGRSWGHLTLAVSSLLRAGTCLRRAGFLDSSESKHMLVDSNTGWKVRLLEGGPAHSR